MRKSFGLPVLIVLMVIVSLSCGGCKSKKPSGASSGAPQSTPDLQATIDAAVEATCEAPVDILAVGTATSNSVIESVPTRQPAPTPPPTEAYETLAEDKLRALIQERVQMATKASTLAADNTTQAIADGAITSREVELMFTYWYYAQDLVAYADEVIVVYNEVYAEQTAATIAPLQTVDGDLKAISTQAQAIIPLLEQLGQALDQGLSPTSQDLDQLKTTARIVEAKAAEAQEQAQAWTTEPQPAAEQSLDEIMAEKPAQVSKNRNSAIYQAYEYADAVGAALADQKITFAELGHLAQLGVKSAASLSTTLVMTITNDVPPKIYLPIIRR